MKRCGMCGRLMLPDPPPHWRWILLRGRINCGGDCLRCMRNVEEWLETTKERP